MAKKRGYFWSAQLSAGLHTYLAEARQLLSKMTKEDKRIVSARRGKGRGRYGGVEKDMSSLIAVNQIFFPHLFVVAQTGFPTFAYHFFGHTCNDLLPKFRSADLHLDRIHFPTDL